MRGSPSYPNALEFLHGPGLSVGEDIGVDVKHFFLHVAGQKNLTLFPSVPGCFFTHLLIGFSATYESHVLKESPLKRNSCEFSHSPRSSFSARRITMEAASAALSTAAPRAPK